MIKRVLSFLLALLSVAAFSTPIAAAAGEDTTPPAQTEPQENEGETAEEPAEEPKPVVYTSFLYVAGQPAHAGEFGAFNGTNYITLKAAMRILDPEAEVKQENGVATVETHGITITAAVGKMYVEANGRCLYVPDGNLLIKEQVAIPAKVLAKIFNMDARYDGTYGVAFLEEVEGREPVLTSGEAFYDATDLDLLSHIIYNEAGNQTMQGKIAVGNVVMNRVASPLFPNTVDGVVYQKNQFYPRGSAAMSRPINTDSLIAAKLVMDGAVVLPNAYFFTVKGLVSWVSMNRTYVATIGNIDFYG